MEKTYKAEVAENTYDACLKVTHNGYQYSTIRIDDWKEEIPKILDVLTKYMLEKLDESK